MKYMRICAILLAILFVSASEATPPSIPSLKMEMTIQHDGNWEVGKADKVTFIFKPLEEVTHITSFPDEVELQFDSGLALISGDTAWTGFLEKGRVYSMSLVLKPSKPGNFGVGFTVHSCLTKIRTDAEVAEKEEEMRKRIEGSPELKRKSLGLAKAPKKLFRYYNSKTDVFKVTGKPSLQEEDTTWHEINGTKIRRVTGVKTLNELGPPPKFTGHVDSVIAPPDSTIHLRKAEEDSIGGDSIRPR